MVNRKDIWRWTKGRRGEAPYGEVLEEEQRQREEKGHIPGLSISQIPLCVTRSWTDHSRLWAFSRDNGSPVRNSGVVTAGGPLTCYREEGQFFVGCLRYVQLFRFHLVLLIGGF